MTDFKAVICGAGIAGAEAALRLRRLAGERVAITLVSPNGRMFAAGDATDFLVKHGGIGSQQADTAAAGIAHLASAADPPPPLRPVIRGMLMTGRTPLYIAAHLVDGRGWLAETYDEPPWPADEKVIAEELGPYLAARDADPAAPDRLR